MSYPEILHTLPAESFQSGPSEVWRWNDASGRTNEERAQMWGKFVAAMGYTEDA